MRAAMMYMVWRSSSPCAVVMADGLLAEHIVREEQMNLKNRSFRESLGY